uniref:glycine-rich domain-containing protein n=2 Tax=Atlantibacter hermannii TaxID=565 RepID=UPI0035E3FAD5
MHRIDTSTALKDKFGVGKNGFTRGNPQTGTPATDLDDDFFDMLQEELVGVVEAAGLALDKGRHNQLLESIRLMCAGRLLGTPKVLGSSGSYTPGTNVKAILVEIVGAGGGGGAASSSANYNAAGGGGGGGGYSKKYIPISSAAAIPYTVGQGGNGATYPASSGQVGGTTTFGSGFSATGGSGGNTASSNASSSLVGMGGGGGTGSGGNINSTGSGGQNGVSSSPTIAGGTMGAGFGGASAISGQGGPGGGGPGAVTNTGNQTVNGNRGNDGVIIIWEFA